MYIYIYFVTQIIVSEWVKIALIIQQMSVMHMTVTDIFSFFGTTEHYIIRSGTTEMLYCRMICTFGIIIAKQC